MTDIKLDELEQDIENNVDNFVPASQSVRDRVQKSICDSNKKNRVTLRLSNQTIEKIKQKAGEEGLPYQTLISSILFKYANDQLVDEKAILHSIKIIKDQNLFSSSR